MSELPNDLQELRQWMSSPRFAGTARTYTAEDVLEQRGTIRSDYTVARLAAEGFYARLRELFAERRAITTFGPYSPGQAVAIKRAGIEGIYLGGWATSAKGSLAEDPGPDLASYPLSQVPDEAAALVRALLAADRNQHFARSRMNDAERVKAVAVDFRPFIIADADTGHGGDAHVRNLIRRFVEIGVPGYHIEDQKPGAKKCGHQAGKVLVAQDEQNKRLNAARFQLDIMGVPGILVARTDAEAATLIDSRSDERDQPFLLGATNLALPSYKAAFLALIQRLHALGADNIRGHLLYALSSDEYAGAQSWLDKAGLSSEIETTASLIKEGQVSADAALESVGGRLADAWQAEAGVKTYARAVADVIEFRANEGEHMPMAVGDWLDFAQHVSFFSARERARSLGVNVIWSCEHARTPEGYYPVDGSVEYAIAKSLGVAPFADILWMETKTADLKEAAHFAQAIHAKYPDKMLAYNLSPSFSWDTTGMSDEQMRNFPVELGKLGFVFNFITYGGHQIDGLAGEEFAQALREDGMLALARLQRKLRLLESPYRTPQTLVGGPRVDAGLMASSGRTATTKAMGKGSTQFQHLVQTELPPKVLREWIDLWSAHYKISEPMRVELRPHTAGSELLELSVSGEGNRKLANIIFGVIQDRRGSNILSIRDQNTLDVNLRKKRLATLMHLFLIQRYRIESVHYVSPTDDNQAQCARMKAMGIYRQVNDEVGEIIVATVNPVGIQPYVASDRVALNKLIAKQL